MHDAAFGSENVLASHEVHSVASPPALEVPAEQSAHAPSFTYCPGEQLYEHEVEPYGNVRNSFIRHGREKGARLTAGDVEVPGHAVHSEAFGPAYVFLGHVSH